MASKRDLSIDVMRGIAIITMVAANMAPYTLAAPHPFLFRFYGTFAAPLFIMLSGMMIALKGEAGEHDFKYYLVRGGLVLAVAALIDALIWHIVPFVEMDVLYLIGISVPLVFLFLKLSTLLRWLAIGALFLLTPVLEGVFGYKQGKPLSSGVGRLIMGDTGLAGIVKSWLIDGYFPLFPWLGIAFLGPVLQKLRLRSERHFATGKTLLAGVITTLCGSLLWLAHPGELLIVLGYSELFYPPTLGYVITSVGVMILLFCMVDWKPDLVFYEPLRALGESSLFIYVFHLAIIKYGLARYWPHKDFSTYLAVYIVFMIFLTLSAYLLRVVRRVWPQRPFLVKFLIG
jgi:uncharacterized membrane protein